MQNDFENTMCGIRSACPDIRAGNVTIPGPNDNTYPFLVQKGSLEAFWVVRHHTGVPHS